MCDIKVKEMLIEKHKGAIIYAVEKFVKHYPIRNGYTYDVNDLYQNAYVALIEYANKFDSPEDIKFPWFSVKNAIYTSILSDSVVRIPKGTSNMGQYYQKYKRVSMDSLIDIENPGCSLDDLCDDSLKQFFDSLSAREKKVIQMTFFDNMSRTDICKEFGCTSSSISQCLRAIKNKYVDYCRRMADATA